MQAYSIDAYAPQTKIALRLAVFKLNRNSHSTYVHAVRNARQENSPVRGKPCIPNRATTGDSVERNGIHYLPARHVREIKNGANVNFDLH